MSLDSVEAALSQAAIQIKPGQSHYPSLFDEDGFTPTQRLPTWLIDPVRVEIERTPQLSEFAQRFIQSPGSGQRLSSWNVARALVYRLFAGVQPRQIVSDLVNLAERETCNTWTYVGLYGGGVSEQIDLAEGVAVMPATAAPVSLAREVIFGIDRHGNPIFERGFPRWRPSIALLISEEMEIFQGGTEVHSALLPPIADKTRRAIRALVLASGHPFVQSWQSSWIAHPAIPYEGFGGSGGSGSFDAMPQPRQGDPVNPALAKDMYSKLSCVQPNSKSAVGLATDRLTRSRTHAPSADTALDLGIASEIILLHGISGSELRYRLSFRGAYLLGKCGPDRAAKFESFRALYDARSEAAHNGTLDPKMVARLPEFDSLCSASIRAVVENQEFPDWDRLTLGIK